MKIIVDGMGGDKGCQEVVKGCVDATKELGVDILIVGQEGKLREELAKYEYPHEKIELLNAEEIISNDEEPALAIRRKKNSSIVVGLNALSQDKGDGFISAGSTGAILAGGLFIVKRINNIERAAIATVYPTMKGISMLIDAGANVDCKPEYLLQFAIMGSIYCEKILGKESPRVGLVNIGTEEGKGNSLVKEAYNLLKETNLNFIGNIEARDIPNGIADVIVCDGFIGNIVLKLTEGMAISIFSKLKEDISKSSISKIGGLMLKPQLKSFVKLMDYREYGGAPLLGLKKPVVKAHGSSDSLAIKNAIKQVKNFVEKDVINLIEADINKNT